jgi:uncharacterized membrane protein HdeD (DUF308 family)
MRKAMATLEPSISAMQRAIAGALGKHWRLFMFEGVLMVILGILAIAASYSGSQRRELPSFTLVLTALFITEGIFQIIGSLAYRDIT